MASRPVLAGHIGRDLEERGFMSQELIATKISNLHQPGRQHEDDASGPTNTVFAGTVIGLGT